MHGFVLIGGAIEKYWVKNRGLGAMASAYNGGLGLCPNYWGSMPLPPLSRPMFVLKILKKSLDEFIRRPLKAASG